MEFQKEMIKGDQLMNHPTIASANGNLRYSKMLKDANSFRQAKKLSGGQSIRSFLTALWTWIAAFNAQPMEGSAGTTA